VKVSLVVRDRAERLTTKSISELSSLLSDPDERRACREVYTRMYRLGLRDGHAVRVGDVIQVLEEKEMSPLLSHWLRGQQPPPPEPPRRPPPRDEVRLAYSPSGAIIEIDPAEASRIQAQEESLAAQREANRQERQPEAQIRDEHQQARDAELERLAPPGTFT
jgi:hypothetical protein